MPRAGARARRGGLPQLCVGRRRRDARRPLARDLRETLARHSGLADFAFAMQGLGSGTISLFGSDAQKRPGCRRSRRGEAIAAFALTEPDAGPTSPASRRPRERDGDDWVLDGAKTYISNGGIADFYVTFARTGEGDGARGHSAFIVAADDRRPRRRRADRGDRARTRSPGLKYRQCVQADALIGEPGDGFAQAMATLDVFRTTVGAAALGFARRALDEALGGVDPQARRRHARRQCGHPVEARRDGARRRYLGVAGLPRRLAARRRRQRNSREAALAKLHATDSAQQVIDKAVQMFGGARRHPRRRSRSSIARSARCGSTRAPVRSAEEVIARDQLAEHRRINEDAAPARLAAAERLFQRHFRERPDDLHRRRGRLGRAGAFRRRTGWPASSARSCATRSRSSPRTAPGPSISCG